MRRTLIVVIYIMVVVLSPLVYAKTYLDIKREFTFGSIADKIKVLEEDASSLSIPERDELCMSGIDFVLSSSGVLGEDGSLDDLAVKVLTLYKVEIFSPEWLSRMVDIFKVFRASSVRSAVLSNLLSLSEVCEDIKVFAPAISLVNAYIDYSVEQSVREEDVLPMAIESMGQFGNASSFNILFTYLKNGTLPEYKDKVISSLSKLSIRYRGEAERILSSNKSEDRYLLFSIIMENDAFDDEFKASISQKMLEDIVSAGANIANLDSSEQSVAMQLSSLNWLTSMRYTRAADTVTKYFSIAKTEYNSGAMAEGQFTTVIDAVASMGSVDAGSTLSQYLDELNTAVKDNTPPTETVTLCLIGALSALGDKVAFDNLLAVTYLDYPPAVIKAAKTALLQLKW